jgi:hypothetical protein
MPSRVTLLWLRTWSLCDMCVFVAVDGQSTGSTPLIAASLAGHVEFVRALVRAGAALNQAEVCEHG